MDELITCTKCREDRDESWYPTDNRRRSSRTPWCRRCLRNASRLRRTGLDPEAYDALLAKQEESRSDVPEAAVRPVQDAVPESRERYDIVCYNCRVVFDATEASLIPASSRTFSTRWPSRVRSWISRLR